MSFKRTFLLFLMLSVTLSSIAQLDAPRKSIIIGGTQDNEVEKSVLLSPENTSGLVSSGTLTIKSKMNLSEPLAGKKKRDVRFMEGEKFDKKDFTALEQKMNKQDVIEDKPLAPKYYLDQYLGDFRSGSKFVHFLYRDHGEVDGDRVSVAVNDVVINPNVYLSEEFRGFYIDLKKGFNKIDIKALNQGTVGANTAHFVMYDDNKQVISSNFWFMATGAKSTVIIVKD